MMASPSAVNVTLTILRGADSEGLAGHTKTTSRRPQD